MTSTKLSKAIDIFDLVGTLIIGVSTLTAALILAVAAAIVFRLVYIVTRGREGKMSYGVLT
jgi:hypothetical protein